MRQTDDYSFKPMEKARLLVVLLIVNASSTGCVQLQGAATGAVTCGTLALASSPEAAFAAAGICGVIGFYYGNKLEQIRVEAFQTEEELKSVLANLEKENSLLEEYNHLLQRRKASLQQELDNLGSVFNIKKEQLQDVHGELAQMKKTVREDLVRIDKLLLPRIETAIASAMRLNGVNKNELIKKLEIQKDKLLFAKNKIYEIVEM